MGNADGVIFASDDSKKEGLGLEVVSGDCVTQLEYFDMIKILGARIISVICVI